MAYDTEVNKGSINMGHLARNLNDRQAKGWRLVHIFEQHGNTVLIFEKDERVEQIIALLASIREGLSSLGAGQPPAAQPTPTPPAQPAEVAPAAPPAPPAAWQPPEQPKRRFGR